MRKKDNQSEHQKSMNLPHSLQGKEPLCWGSCELVILFIILPSQILSSSFIREFCHLSQNKFYPHQKTSASIHPSLSNAALLTATTSTPPQEPSVKSCAWDIIIARVTLPQSCMSFCLTTLTWNIQLKHHLFWGQPLDCTDFSPLRSHITRAPQ